MKLQAFLILSFILAIKAQMYFPIPCQSDNTCDNIINGEKEHLCYKGICMCQNNVTKFYELCERRDAMVGARPKGLRRSCESSDDCKHIKGAVCSSSRGGRNATLSICDCDMDLVPSSDGQECLQRVTEIYARCNETAQCLGSLGADCVVKEGQGRCRCILNNHFAEKKHRCTENKEYGQACTDEEESCYEFSEQYQINTLRCSDKVCRCVNHYQYKDGKCVPYKSAGSRIVYEVPLLAAMAILIAKIY